MKKKILVKSNRKVLKQNELWEEGVTSSELNESKSTEFYNIKT